MKSKNKFFNRIREPKLEGKEKLLSQISVVLTFIAGFTYIIISCYLITTNKNHGWIFRNIGGAIILGILVSTIGIGFIVNRPPKHQIYYASMILVLATFTPFFQLYYFYQN